jgi:hypothetical protein
LLENIAVARYNDFQEFHQQISVFYECPVEFPKPGLFFSHNSGAKLVDRGVKLQAWLKGIIFFRSSLFFHESNSSVVVLANREYLVSGFITSLQKKYELGEARGDGPPKTPAATVPSFLNSITSSIPLSRFSLIPSATTTVVNELDGVPATLEVVQQPNPLYLELIFFFIILSLCSSPTLFSFAFSMMCDKYICSSSGVFKYNAAKKRMTKTSDCLFDSAPHCYNNMSLVYQSNAYNRVRLLYFPWKLVCLFFFLF